MSATRVVVADDLVRHLDTQIKAANEAYTIERDQTNRQFIIGFRFAHEQLRERLIEAGANGDITRVAEE